MDINYSYLIYSNSQYSYLWDIINDYTSNLQNKIYLCIDENKIDYKFNDNIEILYYQGDTNYTKRLQTLLNKINYKYIILIHDVDLILNINENKLENIVNKMSINNIDRVSLGIFNAECKNIKCEDSNIELCNINNIVSNNFFTPFDYAPSIYNRLSILEFYKKFTNSNYQTLEQEMNAQNYIRNNLNVYGIKNKNIKLIYHRGFVYCKDLNFLHITVGGKLLPYNLYFDLENTLKKILDTYNLKFLDVNKNIHINKNEI